MKIFLICLSILASFTAILFGFSFAEGCSETSETYSPPMGEIRQQVRKAGGSR